jgi:lipid A ethanolaminephosphotransferase
MKALIQKIANSLKEQKLSTFASTISLLNLILFHAPFFQYVLANIENGINGIFIVISLLIIMLLANFLVFTLLLFLGRLVGKILISAFFMCNAMSLYFINTYNVMLDDSMMGNFWNTQYSEASGFFSWAMLFYVLALGVIPSIYIFAVKIKNGSFKRFLGTIGTIIASILLAVGCNTQNFTWIDKNATIIGSLILPWSYVVNSVRWHNQQKEANAKEILLPDAKITDTTKQAVVLVIGESARRDHFSLYGYERNTNPLLQQTTNIKAIIANSNATYTTAGVKAILDSQESDELYEILPNYLNRSGVDVIWRTTNWGEPPVHIWKYFKSYDLAKDCSEFCDYDHILITDLNKVIEQSSSNKVLIILHTSTSHGPQYNTKYPAQFETFTPVCNSVELAHCSEQELINAYDNTIVYTDYLLHNIIEQLKTVKDFETTMMYVSDHGESLGENGLYMHGVPLAFAPKEQYEIPFIVWTSSAERQIKNVQEIDQHYVFHSIIKFLNVESPAYNEAKSIF